MPRLLSCACLLLLSANILHAQKYAIRLERPDHVGDRYRLSVSGARFQRSSVSKDGQVLQDATDEYQVSLKALVEVLEVDSKGKPVRKSLTIDTLTKSQKGVESELLKPGTVVYTDGAQPKSSQIVVRGRTLEPEVREALDIVVTTHRPNSPSDDDIFGTADQKGIGESWSINRQLAAEDLSNNGLTLSAENLSGKVSLMAKDAVAGVDCLSVTGTFNADGVRPASLPPTVTVERAAMRGTFGGCFPLTEASLPNRQSMDMFIELSAKGDAGSPMEGLKVAITLQQKVEMLSTNAK